MFWHTSTDLPQLGLFLLLLPPLLPIAFLTHALRSMGRFVCAADYTVVVFPAPVSVLCVTSASPPEVAHYAKSMSLVGAPVGAATAAYSMLPGPHIYPPPKSIITRDSGNGSENVG